MKALSLLKKDHTTVKDLFKQYEKAGDRAFQQKESLFNQVRNELEMHAKIEEEIFYPAIHQIRSEEARDMVLEANEEHNLVKILLGEISVLQPQDKQFDAKMTVLRENVEHHIKEEEEDLFDMAKKHLSEKRLEELGQEMEARKQILKAA